MVFTVGPTFTGVDHASSVVARVETHRSPLPTLQVRSDWKIISSPSWRMAVRVSRPGLLSSGTTADGPNEPSGFISALKMSAAPATPGRLLVKMSVVTPVSSSSNSVGPASSYAELTPDPRLAGGSQAKSSWISTRCEAQMSRPPNPRGRSLWKKSQWPSRENAGLNSTAPVLMTDPRFCGASQVLSTLERWETQRSSAPKPPGRFEVKYRLKPSLER